MRGITCLLGVLLAGWMSSAQADGTHCGRTDICAIEIKVDTTKTPCLAKAPDVVVRHNTDGHATVLVFYIKKASAPDATFESDGIKVLDSPGGALVKDHFFHVGRQGKRIFLITDFNLAIGSGAYDIPFPYEFKVSTARTPCWMRLTTSSSRADADDR